MCNIHSKKKGWGWVPLQVQILVGAQKSVMDSQLATLTPQYYLFNSRMESYPSPFYSPFSVSEGKIYQS